MRIYFIFSFLVLLPAACLGQEAGEMKRFADEIRTKSSLHKDKVNFCQAQRFFLKKEWDSTLLYSMRHLQLESASDLDEYCYYFRAVSFKKKSY